MSLQQPAGSTPVCGIAPLSRAVLVRMVPLPGALLVEADEFLATLRTAFSGCIVLEQPLTSYRLHSGNQFQFAEQDPRRQQRRSAALDCQTRFPGNLLARHASGRGVLFSSKKERSGRGAASRPRGRTLPRLAGAAKLDHPTALFFLECDCRGVRRIPEKEARAPLDTSAKQLFCPRVLRQENYIAPLSRECGYLHSPATYIASPASWDLDAKPGP